MLKNYFKIAYRILIKNKFYSLINILGLSIGMACAVLILLYVIFELSYDTYHNDAANIYRVVKDFVNEDGTKLPDATTPAALAPSIIDNIPDVETAVRIYPSWGNKYLIEYKNKKFYEERVFRADSNFYEIFSYTLIKGNLTNSLIDPQSIILTESSAKKYFGDENPIDKTVSISFWGENQNYKVTAVIKDVPANSHFSFDFLIPLQKDISVLWRGYNWYTYIKLNKYARIENVEDKIQALYAENMPEGRNIFYTQRIIDIHLKSNLRWELKPNGDISSVYILMTVALFIILLAYINYINLSTARSAVRAKEVGIRKASGAAKFSLVFQFISESVLISLVAFIFAIALVEITLPFFKEVFGMGYSLINKENYNLIIDLFFTTIFIGAVAGIYPAFLLSSFQPIKILKGVEKSGGKYTLLRKALVVLQFVISISLIIGSIIIHNQIDFLKNKKVGFDKERVIIIQNAQQLNSREALKQALARSSYIEEVGASSTIIGGINSTSSLRLKGSQNEQLVNFSSVDYNYIKALGIQILEGRNFSKEFPSDSDNGIIINETAVNDLGIEEPIIGKQIVWNETKDTIIYANIIGVVRDFHFTSLHKEVKPYAFIFNENALSNIAIKLRTNEIAEAISFIKATWQLFNPDRPLDYLFLEQSFNAQYKTDEMFGTVFSYITFLAIFIACIGLFALTAFMVEQRTKEIGIRKILGASLPSIVKLVIKEFLMLVMLANLVAWPLAYYFMNKWLEDFAYKDEISIWTFIISGLGALIIALVTVSYQAISAAVTNPIESLRYE